MDNGALDLTGLRNIKHNSAIPFSLSSRPNPSSSKPHPQNPFSLTQSRNQAENSFKFGPSSASEGTGRFASSGIRTRVKDESNSGTPNGFRKPQTSLFSSLIKPKQRQSSVTNSSTPAFQQPFTGLMKVAVPSTQSVEYLNPEPSSTFYYFLHFDSSEPVGNRNFFLITAIRDDSLSPAPESSPLQPQSRPYSKPLSHIYSHSQIPSQANPSSQPHPSSQAYTHPSQIQIPEMLPPPSPSRSRSPSHSHSRPRSSTSFHSIEANDADARDEVDITEIMKRRAREAKMVKADLAEQVCFWASFSTHIPTEQYVFPISSDANRQRCSPSLRRSLKPTQHSITASRSSRRPT